MKKSNYTLLKYMTCTCRDNGYEIIDDLKLRRFEHFLQKTDSSYHRVACGDLFRLYGKKELTGGEKIVVISAHADIVGSIRNPWMRLEDEKLYGTFDNAAGNGCVASLVYGNTLPDNVFVALTMNEEHGMEGASELSEYLADRNITFTAIALDVTYEGYKEHLNFTIENEYWDDDLGRLVIGTAEELGSYAFVRSPAFGKNKAPVYDYISKERYAGIGWPDEAWMYKRCKVRAFSICVPTKGSMHSDDGLKMRAESYEEYIRAVEQIASAVSKNL